MSAFQARPDLDPLERERREIEEREAERVEQRGRRRARRDRRPLGRAGCRPSTECQAARQLPHRRVFRGAWPGR